MVMTSNDLSSESSIHSPKLHPVFGPDWTKQNEHFRASDERVQGGSSKVRPCPIKTNSSPTLTFAPISCGEYALFHGILDTKTVSGAGFASQKTSEMSKTWNLSHTHGLLLEIFNADGTHLSFQF